MGQPATLEQTLIGIVRTLPPERAVELLDFAFSADTRREI